MELLGGANKESILAICECNEENGAALDEKVSEKPAESDHASSNTIPCPDALLELKDIVTDPFCMDLGRMKMLLAATAEAHSSNAPDDLPSYFLNPYVAQELGNRCPPGPCILKENGNFKIACKENIVALPPASSPQKAVILLLTVYFILNLSYPYAFGQFFVLVQAVVVKGEPFDSGLMPFKVKSLLKNLKRSSLILTCCLVGRSSMSAATL